MALFIALEGIDGAGKTTQAEAFSERLAEARLAPPLILHEPGGTPLGEEIGALLKHNAEVPFTPEAELLLFLASRAQLVRDVIRPALAEGLFVLCDRFSASTLAYQGYGRGLDIEQIRALLEFSTDGLAPDLTILLDVPIQVGLPRKKGGASEGGHSAQLNLFERAAYDRFHDEQAAFHERVRQGYLRLAAAAAEDPAQGTWIVLDGTQPIEQVAAEIWARVGPLLRR